MVRLHNDRGGDEDIHAGQIFGLDSPIEFRDGYAEVEDSDKAEKLVNRRSNIHYARSDKTEPSGEAPDDDTEDFDARDFVDRYPMGQVIKDIESGDYDEHLNSISNAEIADRSRKGVLEAIEERSE